MLILQVIGGTIIFLDRILSRELPVEWALAVFLAYLILVLGGFITSSAKTRIPIALAKAAFCVLLKESNALPLLILPSIGFELPGLFPANRHETLFLVGTALASGVPAFMVPQDLVVLFIGSWAISGFVAAGDQSLKTLKARFTTRLNQLEKELAEEEAKYASLEKVKAGQELLIKFQERDRIAQKLHDDLGHTITGSIMQLEAANLLLKDEPDRTGEILEKVSRTLKEGLSAIRMSLKAIKPEPAQLGMQKIQGMLDEFEATYGLGVELRTEGALTTMPIRLWSAIESNLQEALTNMLKHSSGRRFSCRISALNRMYKAEFRDDGMAAPLIRKGMGLEGMESRTREAGGTLIIDTSQGFSAIMLFNKEERHDGDTRTDRG